MKKGNKYTPQCNYVFADFGGIYDDLGTFKRALNMFYEYYNDAVFGTQLNYCFFRSENEKQISQRDIELCRPIFKKLINYLDPSSIITFSKPLHIFFMNNKNSKIKTNSMSTGKKTIYYSKIYGFF